MSALTLAKAGDIFRLPLIDQEYAVQEVVARNVFPENLGCGFTGPD
jgi:hypothetical protein